MADYRPAAVVIVMCGIEKNVLDAMARLGLSHVPHYVTPFPNWPEHQKRFRAIMAKIIPILPKAAPP
jgi:hypothetical protein